MQELFKAVREGNGARVKELVAADPSLAIFAAAMQDDSPELERLLAGNRALVTAVSADGWTPLHLAAHFGRTEAVRLLLNKGADVKARSTNPLRNTALHAAAAGRSIDAAKVLIDFGADVNAQQHSGWVALHAAAQNGDVELARLLLENGAKADARADNQQSPLDLAMLKGQQAMVEFLESRGASL